MANVEYVSYACGTGLSGSSTVKLSIAEVADKPMFPTASNICLFTKNASDVTVIKASEIRSIMFYTID